MTKEKVGGCCLCSHDMTWAENPLVYCDGQDCTVAVHKDCYGIEDIPSGPWFCRKCESQETDDDKCCELCPSKDGALKKTDCGRWAHVLCAFYIPEVEFEDIFTLEPIVLKSVPDKRFKKKCWICETQGQGSKAQVGACMSCMKPGCLNHFHVTCGQAEGLLCVDKSRSGPDYFFGYCPLHPVQFKKRGMLLNVPAFKPPPAAEVVKGLAVEKSRSVPDENLVPLSGCGKSRERKEPKKGGCKSTTSDNNIGDSSEAVSSQGADKSDSDSDFQNETESEKPKKRKNRKQSSSDQDNSEAEKCHERDQLYAPWAYSRKQLMEWEDRKKLL